MLQPSSKSAWHVGDLIKQHDTSRIYNNTHRVDAQPSLNIPISSSIWASFNQPPNSFLYTPWLVPQCTIALHELLLALSFCLIVLSTTSNICCIKRALHRSIALLKSFLLFFTLHPPRRSGTARATTAASSSFAEGGVIICWQLAVYRNQTGTNLRNCYFFFFGERHHTEGHEKHGYLWPAKSWRGIENQTNLGNIKGLFLLRRMGLWVGQGSKVRP